MSKCDDCKWLDYKSKSAKGYARCSGWPVFVANNKRIEQKTGDRYGQLLADFVDCSNYERRK